MHIFINKKGKRKKRKCLVCVFKQSFLIFKQYFTHFHTLFHPHVYLQMFSNNNFQFLNTCTKRALCFGGKMLGLTNFFQFFLLNQITTLIIFSLLFFPLFFIISLLLTPIKPTLREKYFSFSSHTFFYKNLG